MKSPANRRGRSEPRRSLPRDAFGWASRWLDDYFFRPVAPLNLGICRLLFFGLLFAYFLPQDFAVYGRVSESLLQPITAFRLFRIPILSPAALHLLEWVWKGSLLFCCTGLLTRLSTLTALVLGTYLLAVPQNVGRVFHDDAILVFVFLIMAVSRCGDACSIDRWFGKPAPSASGEYRWPIRAAWIVMAAVFFAAGFSKLNNAGLQWAFSDHMSTILIKQQYNSDPWSSWGLWIAARPWLAQTMAFSTLIIEVGYPLALFSRRARWVFPPSMFFAQIGIRVLMGPAFWPFLICKRLLGTLAQPHWFLSCLASTTRGG